MAAGFKSPVYSLHPRGTCLGEMHGWQQGGEGLVVLLGRAMVPRAAFGSVHLCFHGAPEKDLWLCQETGGGAATQGKREGGSAS